MTLPQAMALGSVTEATPDVVAERTVQRPGVATLSPPLDTGHPLLDNEHRFLEGAMAGLRQICDDQAHRVDCTGCSKVQQASCESQLISLLGDVFAFIIEHFRTEEIVMRDSLMLMVDREVCHAHMEDHAEIASKVQEIVMALEPAQGVRHIRELDALFRRWIDHHMALHDQILSRWLKRDDTLYQFR